MSQHDLDIANQTASATRSDINNALAALGSTNSGATEPATTYANMMWYDTTTQILKIRSEADDAWSSIGYVDQSSGEFKILDDTIVATTAGVTAGLLGDQTTATWETGTGTTESLVSPAKVKASVIANAPSYTQPTTTGAVGTYAMMQNQSGSAIGAGGTVAGSSLRHCDVNWSVTGTPSASGTWRVMGRFSNSGTGTTGAISVCIRIS